MNGCVNPPTPAVPVEFQCVVCHGRGAGEGATCSGCDGSGSWRLEECPYRYIDGDTLDTLYHVDLADRGIWPLGHSSLLNTAWFVDVVRLVGRERRAFRPAPAPGRDRD